ncbi:cytochrome P450 [Favolaschia claudopus]|uniref:Cytochrome P450 n=1 Tax=Favolaschia claudopus TaxID=2862362 RepID=A0AAW0CAR4_9AGAR
MAYPLIVYALVPLAAYGFIKYIRVLRLRGPPSPSFVFGHTKEILEARSPAVLYDRWAQEYGSVFQVQGPLGTTRLVTGPGNLLVALGDWHARKVQRKILNPLFSPAAIKTYASSMYDSAYKYRRFDTIGLAAFSTDFKSLDGVKSPVSTALTALGHSKPRLPLLPILFQLPLPRSVLVTELSNAMDEVIDKLIKAADSGEAENLDSALGVLVRAKELSPFQVRIPMQLADLWIKAKSILLAGFSTTASMCHSDSLTSWALVELSMHPEKQKRLRAELSAFSTADPLYDDLNSPSLPYLDAVVREALRLHPILAESPRIVPSTAPRPLEDDVLPLATPIRTPSGALIDSVPVRKGTVLTASLNWTNLSKSVWGEDAAEFKPERWLNGEEGIPASAKEYPGYHHTMIFSDGPRTCLGKGFALTEMKVVLSLLIRKFVFSPRDGMDTKYEKAMFLGPHPKVADEPGGRLPMRVRRVE